MLQMFCSFSRYKNVQRIKRKGRNDMAFEATTQIANTYCDYIIKLPGVINANVVFDEGEITEIHVLANTARTPKQIVRDVQSLFMAQFHREIDHKIVSVAQIDYEMRDDQRPRPRFIIDSILIAKKRTETQIEVALTIDSRSFTGKYTALNDVYDIQRGIAVATLEAVMQYDDRIQTYSILDVRFLEMAGERLAVVCVSLTPNGGITGRLSGTCFSSGDDSAALVKATLDSINRVVGHN